MFDHIVSILEEKDKRHNVDTALFMNSVEINKYNDIKEKGFSILREINELTTEQRTRIQEILEMINCKNKVLPEEMQLELEIGRF